MLEVALLRVRVGHVGLVGVGGFREALKGCRRVRGRLIGGADVACHTARGADVYIVGRRLEAIHCGCGSRERRLQERRERRGLVPLLHESVIVGWF